MIIVAIKVEPMLAVFHLKVNHIYRIFNMMVQVVVTYGFLCNSIEQLVRGITQLIACCAAGDIKLSNLYSPVVRKIEGAVTMCFNKSPAVSVIIIIVVIVTIVVII